MSMPNPDSTLRFLLGAAAAGVLLVVLAALSPVLVPFLQAAFLIVILSQPVSWLCRKGLARLPAVLVVVMSVALGIALLAGILGTSLVEIARTAPAYEQRLDEWSNAIAQTMNSLGVTLSLESLDSFLEPRTMVQFVALLAQRLGSTVTRTLFVILLVVFGLLEMPRMATRLSGILQDGGDFRPDFQAFATDINRYLIVKTWMGLATGLTAGVLIALIGVEHALLWGTLTFLLNYIPNIGSLAAAVLPVLFGFLQLGAASGFLVILVYILVNLVFGSILEPRFLGREVGFPPVIVLMSLVLWGWVFEVTGVLLAVPLSMALRFALESGEETQWIAALISARTPEAQSKRVPQDSSPLSGDESDS
jgi:predicted PurR-regulated permease PerM